MSLTTLARELGRESIPRSCCGTREFLSISRTPSSRWTKATVSVTVLSYLLFFGALYPPVSEWHREPPALKWSGLASFLVLLNKLLTGQCRSPGRDRRRERPLERVLCMDRGVLVRPLIPGEPNAARMRHHFPISAEAILPRIVAEL